MQKIRPETHVLDHPLDLLGSLPPADHCLGAGSGTLALKVVVFVRREELLLGQDVNCHWFHCGRGRKGQIQGTVDSRWPQSDSRYTSRMTTLLFGGVRWVLLVMHTRRAFRCCLPTLGNERWFTVSPSGRCSKDSSMTVLSRYQVTFGRGRPAGEGEEGGQRVSLEEAPLELTTRNLANQSDVTSFIIRFDELRQSTASRVMDHRSFRGL